MVELDVPLDRRRVDRVRLGYVTDFIDLKWWPAFNLADSFIVVGVAILLGALVAADRAPRPQDLDPIERANWVSAVAEPIARRDTEFWTDRTKICIIIPSPTPAMTMFLAASPFVVWMSIRQSRSIPRPRTTGPIRRLGR